ncbi:lamin-L(I) [Etheostoma spectabile]|uniref:lamin-L(I) n=1 Tax=Etheostoma spectabile TaxID=54343 RepID=UPI0013AFABEA|nr:lamin-L(I)-like [Etheostoma spectabile]
MADTVQQSCRMIPQTEGRSLQAPLRPLSVLVFCLFLTQSSRGQSLLLGPPQAVVALVGDNVILPCHLEPAEDVTAETLEWTRSDLDPGLVYVWRNGQDLVKARNPFYKGRASLFIDELKRGNISLKLSNVQPSDQGTYACGMPLLHKQSSVKLVVVSGAVSSPVIRLAGTDRDKGGAVLQCESGGWYPEPEVSWLDAEGNLLSAGPTETVRGPDDLYTVSSRVTVEKRPSNRFTCRVQQKDTNQTRDTNPHVTNDFFEVQCSSSSTITGLAVSLAVCILLLLFSVWNWRQNKIKTKRSTTSEAISREEKNTTEIISEDERKPLKGKGENERKPFEKNIFPKLTQSQKEQQKKDGAEEPDLTQLEDINKEKGQDHVSSQSTSQDYSRTSPTSQDWDTGRITVEEINLKGTYVRLSNKSNQIWDRLSGVKRDNANLVWSTKTSWGTREHLLVYLYSKTGELEASKMFQLGTSQNQQENDTCVTSQDSDRGHIMVDEVDPEGKYVRLCNKSRTDQQMKDWELYLHVNNKKPIIYTFRNSLKLKAGETIKIWASGCGVNNDTATDLVWRNQNPWGTGEQLLVSLYRKNGELEARKISEGRIIVNEVDPEGKYVRLTNKSNKDKPLEGWELHLQINNRKPSMFRFFYSFILKAGETVTIWASGCLANDNPPTDLLWRNQNPWGTGEHLLVSLYSKNGEEMDTRTVDGKMNSDVLT